METIMANGLNWLTKHVPGLGFITFLMVSVIWVTVMITNFTHRLAETERICDNINTRQLPEIRAEMDSRFSKVDERLLKVEEKLLKVDERLLKVEERLLKIEMQLNTIITYIETKEGRKPKFP